MGWQDVARATIRARARDRSLHVFGALGLLFAAGLAFSVAAGSHRASFQSNPVVIVLTYGAFGLSLATLLGLAAGALDPAQTPGETRGSEAFGAWIGALAAGVAPVVLGELLGLLIGGLAGGTSLGDAFRPFLAALVATAFVGAAWCAVSLALTARSPNASRALLAALAGYAVVRVVVPVAAAIVQNLTPISTDAPAGGVPGWWLAFTYLDPTSISLRYLQHMVGNAPSSPPFAEGRPALDNAYGMLAGLAVWCAVALTLAFARWPAAASPEPAAPEAAQEVSP